MERHWRPWTVFTFHELYIKFTKLILQKHWSQSLMPQSRGVWKWEVEVGECEVEVCGGGEYGGEEVWRWGMEVGSVEVGKGEGEGVWRCVEVGKCGGGEAWRWGVWKWGSVKVRV